MNDGTLSIGKCIAGLLWVLVALLMMGAWLVAWEGKWPAALLMGQTACALSAIAATRHIRCYMVRLANIIRVTGRVEAVTPPAEVRPFPRQPVR